MKKFLKILLIVAAILVTLLVAAYLYLRFMPEKSVSKQEANFTLTAKVLVDDYNLNPDASDRKYIDRIIEVTGIISEISTDQNNSTVFILRDNDSETGVLCTLENNYVKKAKKYKVGNTVTIKGTCTGMIFEVVLNKCVIVK
jgi:hypothetical protein